MRLLLSKIEPRFEPRFTDLVLEEDEYLEVIFFIKGTYKIGYTLNSKTTFVLPFKSNE